MKISISNIAWDTALDANINEVLASNSIQFIDIAPPKYFPKPTAATEREITTVREAWAERGIAVAGMQSLLFGTKGLNVFGDACTQKKMLDHLESICHIGKHLGATYLVFGSPKNRDPTGLESIFIERTYLDFFRRLGDIAAKYNTIICLEPNPKEYGANFMTNSEETASVVRNINHDCIAMQLDTGAMLMNGENPARIIQTQADIIGHIHISEPKLAPVGSTSSDHKIIAANIKKYLPEKTCTIEMLTSAPEKSIAEVQQAVEFTCKHYGDLK